MYLTCKASSYYGVASRIHEYLLELQLSVKLCNNNIDKSILWASIHGVRMWLHWLGVDGIDSYPSTHNVFFHVIT